MIGDGPQDAIVNRFAKLLVHLAASDERGDWGAYLENGSPKWAEIAVAGQSQGGGMAAFIAKRVRVARVISFSGGWDRSSRDKIARWYSGKSATPPERWYGTYNAAEPNAGLIAETYRALAIPDDHVLPLSLEARPGRTAHADGVGNPAYEKQWIEVLGSGRTPAADRPK